MNTRRRSPWVSAGALVALFVALQAAGLWPALRYERDAVLNGEVWRLLTAHTVHLGWTHLALNAAGVMLCCALAPAAFERPPVLLALLAVLGLGVSLPLMWWSPQVGNYAGFSGVLYGLYVWGLAPQAARRDLTACAALALLVGWAVWQLFAGPAADEERLIGGRIIAQAHAWGVITAVVCLGVRRVWWRARRPD